MLKKPKKAERTRAKIFAVAMNLFQKHGFDSISVEQITTKAQVAKGTFFSHFPTKDAVLMEIGEILFSYVTEKTIGKLPKSEKAKILLIFRVMAEWHYKNKQLSALITRLVLGTSNSYEPGNIGRKKALAVLTEIIRKGQEAGEFPNKTSPEIAAETLMGAYLFHLVEWHMQSSKKHFPRLIETSTKLILGGLCTS